VRRLLGLLVLLGALGAAAAASSAGNASPSPSATLITALNRLPQTDFPTPVSQAQPRDRGNITFSMSFDGLPVVLRTTAESVDVGKVGTLSRSASAYVVRFTRILDRVAPIRLPNGLTIAAQTITLDPARPSTIRIDRHTGVVTADAHWVIDAPNTLYNGSHTITLPDKGPRRLVSFKHPAPRLYILAIRTGWHATVRLVHWSVAGHAQPGGVVRLAATWDNYFVGSFKR